MKTLIIAAATAFALASGAAYAATPSSLNTLAGPVGGQAEVASTNSAPVGFYNGTAADNAAVSIARYAAAQQGTARTVVGSASLPNDYHTSNG